MVVLLFVGVFDSLNRAEETHVIIEDIHETIFESEKPIFQEFYEGNSIVALKPKIDSIINEIDDAVVYINTNRFWVGEEQRIILLKFLGEQKDFFEQIPKQRSMKGLKKLLRKLDRDRRDIYSYRESLFKEIN